MRAAIIDCDTVTIYLQNSNFFVLRRYAQPNANMQIWAAAARADDTVANYRYYYFLNSFDNTANANQFGTIVLRNNYTREAGAFKYIHVYTFNCHKRCS